MHRVTAIATAAVGIHATAVATYSARAIGSTASNHNTS
jgi:hypothetical protein